jgi:Tfp pilus assembly protein PilV
MSLHDKLKRMHEDQGGTILIEVLVSGILMVIVALGAFTAFDSATRSTAEERHRARANSLAEADLSRMRSMRISDLSNLSQTRTVVVDEQRYTISSRAEFQTDSTGTASCEAGSASADYIKISSNVTWPSIGSRPPVVSATLVAPPNGSISANSGALAIAVEDAANVGIPGVTISGSGAGSFSGVTGSTGCVIFGNLPAGSYSVSVSGVAAGLVDNDGNPPGPVSTSVVGESTNTLVLQYDDPGDVPVRFTTLTYGPGSTVASTKADSVLAFNTGLSLARTFGTVGTPQTTITAAPLFPFTSDYAVYAGICEQNNPNPADDDPPPWPAAIASVLVPPGGSQPAIIQLPALHLTAYTGNNTASTRAVGAIVNIRDTKCGNVVRSTTTNSVGRLDNPGLPFSIYDVCVQRSGPTRHRILSVDLNTLAAGITANFFLGTSAISGACPSW